MNINYYFSNINAKYFKILKFQNLLKFKGFLDLKPKPICKIHNHMLTSCSNFVTEQEKPQQTSRRVTNFQNLIFDYFLIIHHL
jgi:hypothetical protein